MKRFSILVSTVILSVLFAVSADAIPVSGGLLGEYYDGSDYYTPSWDNLAYSQIDSTVDFDWIAGSPDFNALGNDYFSIKWTGWINIETEGNYTFGTNSDDSSMVYIDGNTVVNNNGNHGTILGYGSIYLTTGLHALVITYHEYTGDADINFVWQAPTSTVVTHVDYSVVPSDVLYYDNGEPATVPEPGTFFLIGFSLAGLSFIRRKIKKS